MPKANGSVLSAQDLPQAGTVTIPAQTVNASSSSPAVPVAFPFPFNSSPQVALNINTSPAGTANLTVRASAITVNGFNAYVFNTGTAAATFTNPVTLGWIAST